MLVSKRLTTISPANIARPLTIQCGARDCGNAHQPSKTFRGSKRNPSYRTALNRIYQAAPPFKAILPVNIVFLKTSAGAEHHGISSKLYPAKCICPLAHIRSRRSVRGRLDRRKQNKEDFQMKKTIIWLLVAIMSSLLSAAPRPMHPRPKRPPRKDPPRTRRT